MFSENEIKERIFLNISSKNAYHPRALIFHASDFSLKLPSRLALKVYFQGFLLSQARKFLLDTSSPATAQKTRL